MIVAFTGHRPSKLGGYGDSPIQQRVRQYLRDVLTELKPAEAISGMALGVDQWAAEECLALGIPFIAAVPCDGQEKTWPAESQERYRALLEKAAFVQVVSPGPYAGWKMQRRNEWMVDNADLLIAVWDGTPGGTGNCVQYAQKVRCRVRRINPTEAA